MTLPFQEFQNREVDRLPIEMRVITALHIDRVGSWFAENMYDYLVTFDNGVDGAVIRSVVKKLLVSNREAKHSS